METVGVTLAGSPDAVRGRLITLEGGDGAGKSTQTRLLVDRLRAAGLDAMATREPGGSPGAEAIRGLLVSGAPDRWDGVTEALLMFAARRDHWVKTIRPALARGVWVVSDRFADSTMAYQGHGQGLGREPVEQLAQLVLGPERPDLTLILDVPPATGLARAGERGGGDRADDNRFERMGQGFHQRLRNGFLDIARREPDRCALIDASQPVETVAEAIWATVTQRLAVSRPEAAVRSAR